MERDRVPGWPVQAPRRRAGLSRIAAKVNLEEEPYAQYQLSFPETGKIAVDFAVLVDAYRARHRELFLAGALDHSLDEAEERSPYDVQVFPSAR